jgi:multicomponent K+:H+ antiporter subunit A
MAWLRRSRDLLVATAGGLGMAALTYAVLVHPASDTIADFFLQNALTGGAAATW